MRRLKLAAIAAALLVASGQAPGLEAQTTPAPPMPGATVTELLRTSQTATGQPVRATEAPFEVVVSTSEIPAGGALPMHKHPWPRYGYVVSGRLRVTYEEAGLVREFGAGEALIEAVDQWHEGRAVGDAPARLIIFDQVPAGQSNVVRR